MQQVSEQLGALDQAWARAGERGGSIDGVDALGAQRLEQLTAGQRLLGGLLDVEAARHHHDHVGLGGLELPPAHRAGVAAGLAGHAPPARQRDHLGHPVTACVGWIEPLEGDRARARLSGDRIADAIQPRLKLGHQHLGAASRVRRLAEADEVVEHLSEGSPGRARSPLGECRGARPPRARRHRRPRRPRTAPASRSGRAPGGRARARRARTGPRLARSPRARGRRSPAARGPGGSRCGSGGGAPGPPRDGRTRG